MKRFFLLLLAAIIGLLPLMSACAEAPLDGYPGIDELPAIDTINNPFEFFDVKNDPNGDGIVTAADALLVMRYCSDLAELTPEQLEAADFNGNGVVELIDALLILRAVI